MSDVRTGLRAVATSFLVAAVGLVGGTWLLTGGASNADPVSVFADGFESGTTSAWTTSSGLTVEGDLVSDGSWAARTTSATSPGTASVTLPAPLSDVTARARVQLVSIGGTSALNFLKLRTASGLALAEVYVTPSRVLGVRNDVTGVSTNSSVVVATGAWHSVELHAVVAGTGSSLALTYDGTAVPLAVTTTDLGSTAVGKVQLGDNLTGRAADAAYDTVSVSGPTASVSPSPTATTSTTSTGSPSPSPSPSPTATPSGPAPGPKLQAARVFGDGFESGNLAAWTSSSGLTAEQTTVADGAWAASVTSPTSPGSATAVLATPTSEVSVDLAVRLSSISGASALNFAKLRTASGLALAELYVTPAGVLGLRNDVTGVSRNSSQSLPMGSWVRLRLHVGVHGAASLTEVQLDGSPVASLTDRAASLGTTPVGRVQLGENLTGRTADVAYDSVTVTPAPVMDAAGDIACDPLNPSYLGGAGTATVCRQRAVSDLISGDPSVTAVAALGDNQYECGGLAAYRTSYGSSWGRFLGLTHPAVGNHEYRGDPTKQSTDCGPDGLATGYYSYFGASAGVAGQGWYSYDVGTWHVVVLNTNCSDAGGCGPGSPQLTWLKADLSADTSRCTLAYWHIPTWTSGSRSAPNAQQFVQALYADGAEVVLTGHEHNYERFAPQSPTGVADPNGVREWVVGTGGANHTELPITGSAPNSEVRNDATYGVLRLSLHDGWYDWTFLRDPGQAAPAGSTPFSDSGSTDCH